MGSNPTLSARLRLRAFRAPGYVRLRRKNRTVGCILGSHRDRLKPSLQTRTPHRPNVRSDGFSRFRQSG